MKQVHFSGGVPEAYEECLRPLLFDPYARWLASKLPLPPGVRVLELAAGTGALTRQLLAVLPPDATLIASDLHQAMTDVARRVVPADPRLQFDEADAQKLPYADGAFDLVLCQFGWMFFPDKTLAASEALRVLSPTAGTFALLTWHSVEQNEVAWLAKRVIGSFFEDDPPRGFDVPYGFHDRTTLERTLLDAGFDSVRCEDVLLCGSSTPSEAARAFCRGTPMGMELAERVPDQCDHIESALRSAYTERYGDGPFETSLSALYVEART